MISKLRYPKITLISGGIVAWGALLVSCVMTDRTVVAPPRVAGATFVGAEACAQCHEDITKGFETATHARIMIKGENA